VEPEAGHRRRELLPRSNVLSIEEGADSSTQELRSWRMAEAGPPQDGRSACSGSANDGGRGSGHRRVGRLAVESVGPFTDQAPGRLRR